MMSFKIALLSSMVATASAYELSSGPRCAMETIPEADQISVEELTLNFAANVCKKSKTPELIPFCGVKNADPIISTVPLAFHILHYEDGRGNVTMDRIEETVRIVNDDWAGRPDSSLGDANTNFRFEIHSVSRWPNDRWASSALLSGGGGYAGTNPDGAWGYKPAVGIDFENVMNIYIGEMRGGVLGVCPFPFFGPPDAPIHGCVVHPGAIVGDKDFDFDGYNEGGTATHEIGHGLGLWHAWQGGCNRNIVDTGLPSKQETNTRGCPDPVPDTCGDGLPDNIHNFMDYSDDDCRWEFTIGQSDRADMVVAAWHPGYLNPEIRDAIKEADPSAWDGVTAFQLHYQAEKLPAFQKALEAMEQE